MTNRPRELIFNLTVTAKAVINSKMMINLPEKNINVDVEEIYFNLKNAQIQDFTKYMEF